MHAWQGAGRRQSRLRKHLAPWPAGLRLTQTCCCRIRIKYDDDEGEEAWVSLDSAMLFLGERAEVPAGVASRRKQRAPQRVALAALHRPLSPAAEEEARSVGQQQQEEKEEQGSGDGGETATCHGQAGGSGGGGASARHAQPSVPAMGAPAAVAAAAGLGTSIEAGHQGASKRQRVEDLIPGQQQQQHKRHHPVPTEPEQAAQARHEGSAMTAEAAARAEPSQQAAGREEPSRAGWQRMQGEQQQLAPCAGLTVGAAVPGGAVLAAGPAALPSETSGLDKLRQRKLQEAVAAIQRVYSGQPRSQLRALHCLELVGVGGEVLRVRSTLARCSGCTL